MIDAIAEVFSVVINFIYNYVPNFGATIVVMTLLVKLITFPLNNKQIQTTRRMQKLQPEMKKIQQKYKDDKEKQNKAVSAFMKENNMNPLAGCLPLLVQFPFLIGIFRILREPDKFLNMEEINRYMFQEAEMIDLMAIPNISFENFFSEISIYYLFPLIAGGTTYLYSQMSMPSDSSQKMMLYLMPAMITVFSFSFPIGLVIYWTMNNIFSIGQHKFINFLDDKKGTQQDEPIIVDVDDSELENKPVSKPKTKKVEAKYEPNKIGEDDSEPAKKANKSKTSTKNDNKASLKDGKTKKKKKGKGKK